MAGEWSPWICRFLPWSIACTCPPGLACTVEGFLEHMQTELKFSVTGSLNSCFQVLTILHGDSTCGDNWIRVLAMLHSVNGSLHTL